MSLVKITLAAALALVAVSAQAAQDYSKQGRSVGQTNQWDMSLSAPFAREQNDRFTW